MTNNYSVVMTEPLDGVSGVETVKTLAGAVDLLSFTIDGLAKHTGVSRRTVDTVRRRYEHAFERLEESSPRRPGRPAIRWRLRPEQVDRVITVVGSLQGSLNASERLAMAEHPDEDLSDSLITVAADGLARISDCSATETIQLLSAARDSLAAAGFGAVDDAETNPSDENLAKKAAFVGSVADLIDAVRSNRQKQIDIAQAKAMSLAMSTASYMPAGYWLPLAKRVVNAPGTVLGIPLLVRESSRATVGRLFPALEVQYVDRRAPGYVQLADPRASYNRIGDRVTTVEFVNNRADLRNSVDASGVADSLILVSKDPGLLGAAQERGAHFVLEKRPKRTGIDIAKLVNLLASGLALP